MGHNKDTYVCIDILYGLFFMYNQPNRNKLVMCLNLFVLYF